VCLSPSFFIFAELPTDRKSDGAYDHLRYTCQRCKAQGYPEHFGCGAPDEEAHDLKVHLDDCWKAVCQDLALPEDFCDKFNLGACFAIPSKTGTLFRGEINCHCHRKVKSLFLYCTRLVVKEYRNLVV